MDATPRHPLADLVTVIWHYVRDADAEPRVGAAFVDPVTFDQQLDRIGRLRTVVGWSQVADALAGGRPLAADAVLLTFDDGLIDHHRTVLPNLAGRGWPAVFFVTARRSGDLLSVGHRIHVLLGDLGVADLRGAVLDRLRPGDRDTFLAVERRERTAGSDPIDAIKRPLQRDLAEAAGPILSSLIAERHGSERDLGDALHLTAGQRADLRADGMTIGGHGRQHLWLDWEPADRVRAEIADSVRLLAPQPKPWAFAYPYGAGNPVATAALDRAAFAAAFHAAPRAPSGRFDLGRIDAEDGAFAAALEGATR